MKVLLINSNFIKTPRPALPIGMGYIAASLKRKIYDVDVLDLCWTRKYHIEVINKVTDYKPDVIGISFRNLDNVTFLEPVSYIDNLKRIIQCCRKYSDASIIVGGTGFSVEPSRIMDYVRPDFGIIGEGEEAIERVLEQLSQNTNNFNDIPGLVYYKDSDIIINEMMNTVDLNCDSFPDRSIYASEYFEEIMAPSTDSSNRCYSQYETIQSKRGCELACSYCVIKKVQGNGVRKKNPQKVIEEIRYIQEQKPYIKEFEFVDATFNCPEEHAIEICEAIIESGLKIKWNCEMSPKFITPKLVELLEKSGCHRIELGTDSLSDIGLITLNKLFDYDTVKRVDDMLSKTSMIFTHCIFLGAPGEDEEAIKQVLERWNELKSNQVFATLGIRIYENTQLYDRAIQDGVINQDHNPLLPTFYIEPSLMKNMDTFKVIQEHVNKNEKWYLWWGLDKYDLRDVVKNNYNKLNNMYQKNKILVGL